MKSTDSGETNKAIIPVFGIQIIRSWGKNELTLQQFILDKGLHAYEPGKISPLSKDELQNYPTKKIPYLIFDKQELSEYQEQRYSELPRIDNLPVLENIDKEKTILFLKIRALHDRNKLDPFNKAVSRELEERMFEYYKKYKKDFSGTIKDDKDPFWEIRFDFPPPIERDKNKEFSTWEEHIQPIVERYNLKNSFGKQFTYKFFSYPRTISKHQIDSMLRETMALCQEFPEEKDSDDFFDMVIGNLHNGITEIRGEDGKKVDLKNMFRKFLAELFKEKKLPAFLAFVNWECPKNDNETTIDKQKIPARKIQDLMVKAKPELDKLHQTLKKKVTFSAYVVDREKKFQEVALERFKKNSDEFELVRLKYLEDKDLYNLYRSGQEKGDFIGKLLRKILKDHNLGDHGFQKCYDIYKDTLKSKTD